MEREGGRRSLPRGVTGVVPRVPRDWHRLGAAATMMDAASYLGTMSAALASLCLLLLGVGRQAQVGRPPCADLFFVLRVVT